MLFLNKKEVNYELYYRNTFIRIFINKKNSTNKYLIKNPKIELFFWIKKIKEEDLFTLNFYNNCMFFWLITNNIGKIKKLEFKLSRGIRYARFIYICKINPLYFFKFINFINEILNPIIEKNTIYKHTNNKNTYLISYSDLSIFTNLKLSNNFYLNSINNKMFLKIKKTETNLDIFLNLLKINGKI